MLGLRLVGLTGLLESAVLSECQSRVLAAPVLLSAIEIDSDRYSLLVCLCCLRRYMPRSLTEQAWLLDLLIRDLLGKSLWPRTAEFNRVVLFAINEDRQIITLHEREHSIRQL